MFSLSPAILAHFLMFLSDIWYFQILSIPLKLPLNIYKSIKKQHVLTTVHLYFTEIQGIFKYNKN